MNRSGIGHKLDEIIKEATSGDFPTSGEDDRVRTTFETTGQPDSPPEQYGQHQYHAYSMHDQNAKKV